VFDANATGARLVFPELPKVDQRGYFYMTQDDDHCSIMITEYDKAVTEEDVARALLETARRYSNPKYGKLETLRIDGRPAWGWLTTQLSEGELSSLEYTAIISYEKEQKTYAVEFYASVFKYMDESYMKRTLESFAVEKESETSYGQIGLIALLVIGVGVGYKRLRPTA
jgi:hypothetical protein